MAKEQEEVAHTLSGIRINLTDHSVIFEAQEKPVAKLTLTPSGVIFEALQHEPQEASTHQEIGQGTKAVLAEAATPPEAAPRVVLTGRLKSQPREGRPDRTGKPTAYARFAAHEEDKDKAHDYIATFHRHTTPISLMLPKDAQITVEGYPHPSGSESRLDTFSVINLLNYPGKQPKK